MEKNPSTMVECQPEESSWTFYIEEFMRQDTCFFSSEVETPSLVSDATSSAVQKLGFRASDEVIIKPAKQQVSFKKKKKKTVPLAVDYDLEDTASSPVNSPKVCYMKQLMEKGKMENPSVSDLHDQVMMRRNVMIFSRGTTEWKRCT